MSIFLAVARFAALPLAASKLLASASLLLAALTTLAAGAADAPRGGNREPLTVDAFSVVRIHTKAVPDARSNRSLGPEREGTGIVIDSSGLILTIGYLIQEAESVEIATSDGRSLPASVIAYDFPTGFGLLRAVKAPPIRPIALGDSSKLADTEPVLIVGFDGVAPAFVVSRRPFTGYWEYLLDEAIFTAPATVNWQGAALINKEGKLMGVGSLVVGDAVGGRAQIPGNMFVPIDLLKPILGDLIAQGKASSKARPWLGINTQDLQGKLIVTRVSPESPADKAGLVSGDIIVGIRGEQVQSQAEFYRKLWATGDAGAEVMLDVLKGTEVKKLGVQSIDRESYLRPKPVY
ncbi:MAG TPA: S1C family serine protease [Burkholderiales bacterium]|jgi:S1-C subfamily serine protease|nr:S1C family serine protease [Burkholderiales bacterium]